MSDVVIAGAVRTAIGKFGGALATLPATRLGAIVIRDALGRAGVAPDQVDEVIMGQVLQAGAGLNPARQAALLAGLPVTVPAYTVNKVCASGMKAIALGAQAIASGQSEIVVAGGMENMSAAPFLLDRARWGYRLGDGGLVDVIIRDALSDPLERCHMGITAENLAAEFDISRHDQDEFAARSQQKAVAAVAAGRFRTEIVPVEVCRNKGPAVSFDTDEFPRPDSTAAGLSKLKPAFKQDGTVTAGNASGINDGAAAMVLLSESAAKRRGIRAMARIAGWSAAGVEPARMGLGPVPATRKVLDKAGLQLARIEAVELNEAFAAQAIAVMTELGLAAAVTNPNGGAIALGHPVGASGARIVVTLLHTLAAQDLRLGLATLCVGGGQGMSLIVARD